jgi:hypothetical protein
MKYEGGGEKGNNSGAVVKPNWEMVRLFYGG